MTACARTARARQASRSTIVVRIVSGSLIEIRAPSFASSFRADVKGISGFSFCISTPLWIGLAIYPVPSENFAPRGKKVVKILTAGYEKRGRDQAGNPSPKNQGDECGPKFSRPETRVRKLVPQGKGAAPDRKAAPQTI